MTAKLEAFAETTIRETSLKLEDDPSNEWLRALHDAAVDRDWYLLRLLVGLKRYPVDPEEFLFGAEYLGVPRDEVFPRILEHYLKISSGYRTNLTPKYLEVVLTGGIGTGKTTLALYVVAYQLYVLSCFINPQKSLGQDSMSEIVMVFQSLQGKKAKDVPYARFRTLISKSEYFNTKFRYRTDIESELRFPHRVTVKPVSGDAEGTIGENVLGGFIDEVNFMDVTQDSKRSRDMGEYDQAKEIYNSISRRRESRFMEQGAMPGILCLGSSKNYPGEFTDRKIEESKTNPRIYVFDECVWHIMPWKFGPERFHMFIGDYVRQPRILEDDEVDSLPLEDQGLVRRIPLIFRPKFEIDPLNSLREIAGVATRAIHPFLPRTDLVAKIFGHHKNIFSRGETDFKSTGLEIIQSRFVNLKEPRFAHIDLGVTSDAAGLCIGHVKGFKKMVREPDEEGGKPIIELLPDIHIDGVLRIIPPKGGEINFEKIRTVIYTLRKLGMNVKWVTLDSFQSVDTVQLLRRKGMMVGLIPRTNVTLPYDFTKTTIYDGRVSAPEHPVLHRELVSLEKVISKNMIDHPPNGSKDVADAFSGVVFGLIMRVEIWARWGVTVSSDLVDQIAKQKQALKTEGAETA